MSVLWSMPAVRDPVDKAMQVERCFPGAVVSLRGYLYPGGREDWLWLQCTAFTCYVDPDSLLRMPWLMAWCPDGGRYVWDVGRWRHSLASERVLADMAARGDV